MLLASADVLHGNLNLNVAVRQVRQCATGADAPHMNINFDLIVCLTRQTATGI